MNWTAIVRSARAGALLRQRSWTCGTKVTAVAAHRGRVRLHRRCQRRRRATVTTGVVRGGTVVINDDEGIADRISARPSANYIVRERVPTYTIPDRVVVGGVAAGSRHDLLRRAADGSARRPSATPS